MAKIITGGNEMPENVSNFLNSKDSLYEDHRIRYKLIFLAFILFFAVIEGILYFTGTRFLAKDITLLDFIMAAVFSLLAVINLIAACFKDAARAHYIYFGNNLLLLSCYLFYLSARCALFLFGDIAGLAGIAFWMLLSAIFVLGVAGNIKHDFYNKGCKKIFWFRDANSGLSGGTRQYGIVVGPCAVAGGIAAVAYAVVLAVVFFASIAASPAHFLPVGDAGAVIMSQLLICIGYIFLGYCAHFGWKLLVKQFFINKYGVAVRGGDADCG